MLHIAPHPELHPVFEAAGYALAFLAYRRDRSKAGDVVGEEQRWIVIAAAAIGALLGSRILGLLQELPRVHITFLQAISPGGGKTIVGGLLGAWLAVEIAKKLIHVRTRTGDLFAIPLCIGIATGRIGCLLAGTADDTYGRPTSLPWAVDFGDGISRHPTQAYEILFLTALGLFLVYTRRRTNVDGLLFRIFITGYLTWRLVVDNLKTDPPVAGLTFIQWACVAGLLAVVLTYRRSSLVPRREYA